MRNRCDLLRKHFSEHKFGRMFASISVYRDVCVYVHIHIQNFRKFHRFHLFTSPSTQRARKSRLVTSALYFPAELPVAIFYCLCKKELMIYSLIK